MLEILLLIGVAIILIIGIYLFRSKTKKPWKTNVPQAYDGTYHHVPVNLNREISYMDHLNGYEFEDYVAWLLKKNGFVGIKQTGKEHDAGLDVLAYRHHIAYGIQCKHYKKRRIGRQVIKHTADGAHFYGTQKAIVLTNTRFSREAIRARKFFHVQLWDRSVLIQLINSALTRENAKLGN